jgi:hypothetical protein
MVSLMDIPTCMRVPECPPAQVSRASLRDGAVYLERSRGSAARLSLPPEAVAPLQAGAAASPAHAFQSLPTLAGCGVRLGLLITS